MERLNRVGYELMTLAATGKVDREDGQTMAEYGLILTGIALVVMVTTLLLGTAISDTFQSIIDQL
jgi:Flp pilus assembly pilin Flp